MITSKLFGGLGNQLFQIAAGYSLSRILNTKFVINFSENSSYLSEKIKMMRLNNDHTLHHFIKYKETIFKKINTTSFEKFTDYYQKSFCYNEICKKDNIRLIGYFQSEKFFEKHREEVKNLFEFPRKMKKIIECKLQKFKKKKLGVHIRCYKNNHAILPEMPNVYFKLALEKFNINEYDLIVISDDHDKAMKKLNENKINLLENNNELEDLYALSQCDSVIMSNSTFSWWGAWLGKKKENVIVPPVWFGNAGPQDTQDLIPNQWKILE